MKKQGKNLLRRSLHSNRIFPDSRRTLSKDKLQDVKDKLRAALDSMQVRVKQSLSAAYTSAREHGKEAVEKSRQTIVQNPFIAVGGAFLAGVVLAMLIGRGRHGHSD
jgi:ElaB/YqjD/DUF883 family membrane-anchored ribosome-binding protein